MVGACTVIRDDHIAVLPTFTCLNIETTSWIDEKLFLRTDPDAIKAALTIGCHFDVIDKFFIGGKDNTCVLIIGRKTDVGIIIVFKCIIKPDLFPIERRCLALLFKNI